MWRSNRARDSGLGAQGSGLRGQGSGVRDPRYTRHSTRGRPHGSLPIMGSYRDLNVWKEARSLAREIYAITAEYPRTEIFGLAQQLRRAAVSIICNYAEAQGRWTRREQANFYIIARGSTLEMEAQLLISEDLGFLSPERAAPLIERARSIGRMLNGLIKRSRKLSRQQTSEP